MASKNTQLSHEDIPSTQSVPSSMPRDTSIRTRDERKNSSIAPAKKSGGSVLLRIKRKRDENPMEALLVATEADRGYSKRPMLKTIRRMMGNVSLNSEDKDKKIPNVKEEEDSGVAETKLFTLVDTVSEADFRSKEFSQKILARLKKAKQRRCLKAAPLTQREKRKASRADRIRRFEKMQKYRFKGAQKITVPGIDAGTDQSGELKLVDLETTKNDFDGIKLKDPTVSRMDAVNKKYSTNKLAEKRDKNIEEYFQQPRISSSSSSKLSAAQQEKSQLSHQHQPESKLEMGTDKEGGDGYVYDIYCISQDAAETGTILSGLDEAAKAAYVDMRGMIEAQQVWEREYGYDDSEEEENGYGSEDSNAQEIDYPEEDWEEAFPGNYRDRSRESSSSDLLTDQLWMREQSSPTRITLNDLRRRK
mmetsp:Transcript_6911/g.9531  ORF Transcript_6911/g.9531 Transcript_6911/m.9531 type:complete len:419 (-) Transcript_6911:147-1403(-)|eukprot:CAMPEP_0185261350 /NCGR_PEP_ID=MMETSP1359-20130426/9749_1 /TAXON_ID=552665 /ORGANISM="Bigelowiella longifila, Strain CCMP242" /LENGTH=418 /DNA_ID=CAMNT_0027847929 /DNA_START=89 /DNA_END=1345 /DNA_ORIENTATION=+